jgi:hypothetical protein
MDQVDERFKKIGDLNTGIDLSFEEFKNNHSLRTKLLQDGQSAHANKIGLLETKIKEQHAYIMRLKSRIQEVQESNHRIENIENRLSGDYLSNLVRLQVNQALED